MRAFIAILFLSSVCLAQNGKNYAISSNGRSYGTVALDNSAFQSTGANAKYNFTVTVPAGNSNPLLVFNTYEQDTGSATVLAISDGTNGYWVKSGSTLAGNGSVTHGESWYSVARGTGTITVFVTLSATPSSGTGGVIYALHNANPVTPLTGFAAALSGGLALTLNPGDEAVSMQIDTNSNRSVTGCTTTTDFSAFTSNGHASAHGFRPSCTFTWSGFGANSIATGVVVKHQ